MGRPFRRYCFYLAEKLGKGLDEILAMSSSELSGWMAFDLTNDEDWTKKYEAEKESIRQKSLSNKERGKLFKQLLGGTKDGNDS